MEVGTTIEITVTTLCVVAAIGAASWARSVAKEMRELRDEVLASIGGLRKEVAVRRVIRTMDEVPPELMSPTAREWLDETVKNTKIDAAAGVMLAIDLGYFFSEINRGKNEAAGDYEDAPPSGEDDGEAPRAAPAPGA